MSGASGRSPDEFTVYNVMLPRQYYPAWQGNVYERRCQVGVGVGWGAPGGMLGC